jgi:hypothetical protein
MKRVFIIGLLISTLFSTGFLSTQIAAGMNLSLAQEEFTNTPIPVETETPSPLPSYTPIQVQTERPVPTSTDIPQGQVDYYYQTNQPQPTKPTRTPTANYTRTPTPITYARPLVIMTNYNYDVTAYAGGYFTLDVDFENQGQETAYNVVITIASSDLVPMGNGGVHSISDLDEDDSDSVSQLFMAKSNIQSSPSSVNVTITYTDMSNQPYSQAFTIALEVLYSSGATATPTGTAIGRPQLVVNSYDTDVDILYPGTSFILNLDIQNRGNFEARSANIAIGAQTSSNNDSTTTSNSTDFLPVGSSNVQVLGDVGVGESLDIQQSFIVNSSSSTGAVPVTLSFDYMDPYGIKYSDQQIITLLVYSVPSIQVGFYEDPGTYTVDQAGNLPIQVVNLSASSILLGDISISMQNSTLTNNQVFIGNLDSGGIFTMDSEVTPHQSGTLPIKINVSYQDVFGKTQTITTELSIEVNESLANTNPALQFTPGAGQSGTEGFPGGQTSQESIWQVIFRFFRGLIGLDSSSSQPSRGTIPSFSLTPTP